MVQLEFNLDARFKIYSFFYKLPLHVGDIMNFVFTSMHACDKEKQSDRVP